MEHWLIMCIGAVVAGLIGATVYSGDYVGLMSALLYDDTLDDVYAKVEWEMPWLNRISRVSKRETWSAGQYEEMLVQITQNMNAGSREETEDFSMPGRDAFDKWQISTKESQATIGYTLREMERIVKQGHKAAINLIDWKIRQAPTNLKMRLDMNYAGDGTGRLARISSWSNTSDGVYGTATVDNAANEFGWKTCARMYEGMHVDVLTVGGVTTGFPTASTYTAHALDCIVTNLNKAAGTFKLSIRTDQDGTAITGSALGTYGNGTSTNYNPADNDIVFAQGSVKCTAALAIASAKTFSAWKNPPGMWALIDDGGSAAHEFHTGGGGNVAYNGSWYGATFQGKDRTSGSYPQLRSVIWGANTWAPSDGALGTAHSCDIAQVQAFMDYLDHDISYEGRVTCLCLNAATMQWMCYQANATQGGVQDSKSGRITPGLFVKSIRKSDGTEVDLVPMRQLADGQILAINEAELVLFDEIPIGWYEENGSRLICRGRNATYEQWLRTVDAIAAGQVANSGRMQDIDVS